MKWTDVLKGTVAAFWTLRLFTLYFGAAAPAQELAITGFASGVFLVLFADAFGGDSSDD